jgi:YfiR/HmsC-like
MSRAGGLGAFLSAAVATGLLLTGSSASQTVSAPELKAAVVASLVPFVEWPAHAIAAGAPLVLCVVNDAAVALALQTSTKGRAVNGHGLTVTEVAADTGLPVCHAAYFAGSNGKRVVAQFKTFEGVCVFTVSDAPDFAAAGGMVELFREGDRVRVAVNLDALERAGIRLSSRVLALAKIVRDAPSRVPPGRRLRPSD